MKIGVLTKQSLMIAVAATVTITAITVVTILTAFDVFSKSASDELLREAGLFASLIKDVQNAEQVDSLAKSEGIKNHIRFTVIKKNGEVIADTEKEPSTMENHSDRPEIIEALSYGKGTISRYSETTREQRVYSAILLNDTLVVRASMVVESVKQLTSTLAKRIIPWAAFFMSIMIAISIVTRLSIGKNLKRLAETASNIARGNFDIRLSEHYYGEFSKLAHSIDAMSKELSRMFSENARQRENITQILQTIEDGIIVLDNENRIVFANKSAEKITGFDLSKVLGKDALTILLIPELREIIEGNQITPIEFALDERKYCAEITEIKSLEQRLIVIRDITEQHRIQQTKADFVSNVSHELRTPLSLIKGYAETLEAESLTDEQRKYVGVIIRHTNRMIALVEDLLTLSKIESSTHLEPEKVDLVALVNNILHIFVPKITKNNLTVEFLHNDDIPNVWGDINMLEIAISNLVDNAVKYNKPNGKITVRLSREENFILISVEDTGVGIPQKDCPRIFERFYVVDKSRSQKLGGTGLGLAIVKHIVLLHNGKISVESEEGRGSKFTISLPIR